VDLTALNDPSVLPKLEDMMTNAPLPLPSLIPNPRRVFEEKQDLTNKLREARALQQ